MGLKCPPVEVHHGYRPVRRPPAGGTRARPIALKPRIGSSARWLSLPQGTGILPGEILRVPSWAVLALSRQSHTDEFATGPIAEYRSLSHTDKHKVGQVDQDEQDPDRADGNQDDHYHHQLSLALSLQ